MHEAGDGGIYMHPAGQCSAMAVMLHSGVALPRRQSQRVEVAKWHSLDHRFRTASLSPSGHGTRPAKLCDLPRSLEHPMRVAALLL